MKPFNLDEYLKNPSKKVVTRNGKAVKILCTNFPGDQPIVAQVKDWEYSASFTKEGKYLNSKVVNSQNDLFFAPEKHEGWANIYGKFLAGSVFSTKEEAEEYVKRVGTKDFVATAKIEWEE